MYCKKCGKDVPYGVVMCEECATGKTPSTDFKAPPTVSQPAQTPSRFSQSAPPPPNSGPIPPQSPYPGTPAPNSPYPGGPGPNSPYPGQPFQSQSAPQSTSGMAIGSLVCSLLGLGLIGLILGVVAKNQINASGGRQGGAGLALAGIIIGIVGMVLFVLVLAVVFPAILKLREQARQQNGNYNGTRMNKLNTTPTRIDYSTAIRTASNWSVIMKSQA